MKPLRASERRSSSRLVLEVDAGAGAVVLHVPAGEDVLDALDDRQAVEEAVGVHGAVTEAIDDLGEVVAENPVDAAHARVVHDFTVGVGTEVARDAVGRLGRPVASGAQREFFVAIVPSVARKPAREAGPVGRRRRVVGRRQRLDS